MKSGRWVPRADRWRMGAAHVGAQPDSRGHPTGTQWRRVASGSPDGWWFGKQVSAFYQNRIFVAGRMFILSESGLYNSLLPVFFGPKSEPVFVFKSSKIIYSFHVMRCFQAYGHLADGHREQDERRFATLDKDECHQHEACHLQWKEREEYLKGAQQEVIKMTWPKTINDKSNLYFFRWEQMASGADRQTRSGAVGASCRVDFVWRS